MQENGGDECAGIRGALAGRDVVLVLSGYWYGLWRGVMRFV